mmetsp:Transcript_3866/g.8287  ORF Transcript_3866/g.8287 Transcript_3866/m.8287 type:complete len:276 (+) Transcript_3866:155-982(+)|eukprot:CAMPEP_0202900308 /NCGR_PEP_ID=MMETSP1392-20130828/11008_1 /ASSEMBLY_ACC=CAM_ASM_000868 /TAXON_ID=225041 /ORGANISM="Chlamydomonas chlamydogama, Strain SAG 11-48b" /LENGTH=275 /DNA_ID=CAMNT_0049586677 /DNA_START=154 /DNA_END=981 /DNA_ORIENTATION=-
MVQLEPNLTLTLKNLASQGAVVSAEQQAALDYSLPIKRAEAGLKTLVLWGKVLTLNGKDYLIAEGYNDPLLKNQSVVFEAKYFYSQDGVKWVDLQAVDAETAVRAGTIRSILSGDATKLFEVQEDDPNAPPPPAEGEEEAAGEEEGPKKLVFQIPELAILRVMIDSINATCGVVPAGSMLPDALNRIVVNRLYAGAAYPEKLESYTHRTTLPGGPTLAADLRGTWSVNYDPFRGIAVVRSLLYPGYTFYYTSHDNTWGALYVGDGLRNNDLIFML